MKAHLSNEQIFELLDPANCAVETHLDECTACREELETLRGSLAGFRLAARSFAQQNSPAAAPARNSVSNTPRRFQQPMVWAAGLVAAAALCATGLSANHKYQQPTPAQVMVQPTAYSQKTAVSDEDATLLEGIDRDLATSVPPSLQPLDVASAGETTSTSN